MDFLKPTRADDIHSIAETCQGFSLATAFLSLSLHFLSLFSVTTFSLNFSLHFLVPLSLSPSYSTLYPLSRSSFSVYFLIPLSLSVSTHHFSLYFLTPLPDFTLDFLTLLSDSTSFLLSPPSLSSFLSTFSLYFLLDLTLLSLSSSLHFLFSLFILTPLFVSLKRK